MNNNNDSCLDKVRPSFFCFSKTCMDNKSAGQLTVTRDEDQAQICKRKHKTLVFNVNDVAECFYQSQHLEEAKQVNNELNQKFLELDSAFKQAFFSTLDLSYFSSIDKEVHNLQPDSVCKWINDNFTSEKKKNGIQLVFQQDRSAIRANNMINQMNVYVNQIQEILANIQKIQYPLFILTHKNEEKETKPEIKHNLNQIEGRVKHEEVSTNLIALKNNALGATTKQINDICFEAPQERKSSKEISFQTTVQKNIFTSSLQDNNCLESNAIPSSNNNYLLSNSTQNKNNKCVLSNTTNNNSNNIFSEINLMRNQSPREQIFKQMKLACPLTPASTNRSLNRELNDNDNTTLSISRTPPQNVHQQQSNYCVPYPDEYLQADKRQNSFSVSTNCTNFEKMSSSTQKFPIRHNIASPLYDNNFNVKRENPNDTPINSIYGQQIFKSGIPPRDSKSPDINKVGQFQLKREYHQNWNNGWNEGIYQGVGKPGRKCQQKIFTRSDITLKQLTLDKLVIPAKKEESSLMVPRNDEYNENIHANELGYEKEKLQSGSINIMVKSEIDIKRIQPEEIGEKRMEFLYSREGRQLIYWNRQVILCEKDGQISLEQNIDKLTSCILQKNRIAIIVLSQNKVFLTVRDLFFPKSKIMFFQIQSILQPASLDIISCAYDQQQNTIILSTLTKEKSLVLYEIRLDTQRVNFIDEHLLKDPSEEDTDKDSTERCLVKQENCQRNTKIYRNLTSNEETNKNQMNFGNSMNGCSSLTSKYQDMICQIKGSDDIVGRQLEYHFVFRDSHTLWRVEYQTKLKHFIVKSVEFNSAISCMKYLSSNPYEIPALFVSLSDRSIIQLKNDFKTQKIILRMNFQNNDILNMIILPDNTLALLFVNGVYYYQQQNKIHKFNSISNCYTFSLQSNQIIVGSSLFDKPFFSISSYQNAKVIN